MIGGLMVFARPPKPRPAAADVGGLLAAVIESVRSQAAARGVRLEYSPSPTPCSAFVDRVQVEEAIRVVVLNAIEAVEPGGRVLLGAGATTLGGRDWSWITISDEGRGMSAEEARRAFDPFFSGREAGRGAGLGLPKAWRLIDASGGRVLLESRLGQGTRATITLPATASATVAEAALGAARA
jgi:signal transduction histidine kinase